MTLNCPVCVVLSMELVGWDNQVELDQDHSSSGLQMGIKVGQAERCRWLGLGSVVTAPGLGSCPACLVSMHEPGLLSQLGPAVQQVIPEAGNVLRVLGQCAV